MRLKIGFRLLKMGLGSQKVKQDRVKIVEDAQISSNAGPLCVIFRSFRAIFAPRTASGGGRESFRGFLGCGRAGTAHT